MDLHETSLFSTFKNVRDFGTKYAADFPPASVGGQQLVLIATAIGTTTGLGVTQISGADQKKTGVRSRAVAYKLLHDDLVAITGAAHALVLLGTPGLDGKFLMPRNHGAQNMINTGRAFALDAGAFSAGFLSVGLAADFLPRLNTDINAFEAAIAAKSAGLDTQGGATGGIADSTHKGVVALHILDVVVKNAYKNNPQRLAEWVIASHVEKHTPVPQAKPAPAPAMTPQK